MTKKVAKENVKHCVYHKKI